MRVLAASPPGSDPEPPEFRKDQLTLRPFREALRQTPCIVAGGYKPSNCWDGIERVSLPNNFYKYPKLPLSIWIQGYHDAIAFGRYFTSNADLVERLRLGKPFARYGLLLCASSRRQLTVDSRSFTVLRTIPRQ